MKWLCGLLLFSSCAVAQVTQVAHGGTAQSSYAKGDLLCPSGSTTMTKLAVGSDTQVLTADSTQTCGIKWAATSGTGVLGYSASAVTVTANTYFFPVVGGSSPSTTETNVDTEAPVASTIQNLYVSLSTALGTGNSAVFTYRKNAADQTLTCTISGASATSCNDVTHSFSVAAGDLVTIKAVTTGTIVVSPNVIITASYGGGGAVGGGGGLTLVEQHTASSSAELDFTCISSTYDQYELKIVNIVPATNGANLLMEVSTNGGTTYDNANYSWTAFFATAGGSTGTTSLTSAFSIGGSASSTASNAGSTGTVLLSSPQSTSAIKQIEEEVTFFANNTSSLVHYSALGSYNITGSGVNAFRIRASTGNLASGTVRCYGLSK